MSIFQSNKTYLASNGPLLKWPYVKSEDGGHDFDTPDNFDDWKGMREQSKLDTDVGDLYRESYSDTIGRTDAFENRFGIGSHLLRTEDIAETIKAPGVRLELIIAEFDFMSFKLSNIYAEKHEEFLTLGFDELKSTELTDEYVNALLNEELKILKRKYPYSFDAEGSVHELIGASKQLMRYGRFIKPKIKD